MNWTAITYELRHVVREVLDGLSLHEGEQGGKQHQQRFSAFIWIQILLMSWLIDVNNGKDIECTCYFVKFHMAFSIKIDTIVLLLY